MDAQPVFLSGLTIRESVLDSYYRMAWALDCNNYELFVSAWSTTHEPEFHIDEFGRHCIGMAEIKAQLFDVVANLDTQHIATNARIHIEPGAKSGRMWLMSLNQHFRRGQQAISGSPRLWGGNMYMFDVVMEGDLWKIKEWRVEMGWNEGDKSIVGR